MSAQSAFIVFCDDIRIENTGKLLLIGVYPTDLNAHDPNGTTSLRAYVAIDGDFVIGRSYSALINIYMKDASGSETRVISGDFQFQFQSDPTDRFVMLPPPFQLNVPEVGALLYGQLYVDDVDIPVSGRIRLKKAANKDLN